MIAANNKGVTNNPLDLLNDNRISEIFYDDKDLIEAISQTIHFRKDNVFPSDFFYMNKEKTTRKLFMCEDNI